MNLKKSRLFLSLVLAVAAALPAFAAPTTRYLVATRHAPFAAGIEILRDGVEARAHDVQAFNEIRAFAADLTEAEAAELRTHREVRYLHPVVERSLLGTSGAPLRETADAARYSRFQTLNPSLDLIHAREVWPVGRGKSDVINVAIFDTGVDYNHPDLHDAYLGGYNTFDRSNNPMDDNRHGTHVAGIIAARDNAFGVVGVAPEAKLWAIKVLNRQGNGTDENIVAGINWLLAQKRTVGGKWLMSLSLGASQPSNLEREAYERAMDEGVLVIAAAGNSGLGLEYPAAYPGVLSVGAVDGNGVRTQWSSFGATLGVMAPGSQILSTMPVGMNLVGDVETADGLNVNAYKVEGSPVREVSAPLIDCGLGRPQDYPANAAGYIALVRRGELTFNEKVRAAKAAGAIAVVIYNFTDADEDRLDLGNWTLHVIWCTETYQNCGPRQEDLDFDWPLTIGVNRADGLKLLERAGTTAVASYRAEDYGRLTGTSMSCPHVAGVAALIWALAPDATATQVKNAITSTAVDIGDVGFDSRTGFGILHAFNAARQVAPAEFGGAPGTPAPPPNNPRRPSGH